MVKTETLLELGHLCSQRAGISGIAREHFDRHRAAVTGAQQAEYDLQLVAFAVAAVAASCQRTGAALEIGRTHIVEHQGSLVQMALRKAALDAWLLAEEPVERGVEFLLADRPQFHQRAKR